MLAIKLLPPRKDTYSSMVLAGRVAVRLYNRQPKFCKVEWRSKDVGVLLSHVIYILPDASEAYVCHVVL